MIVGGGSPLAGGAHHHSNGVPVYLVFWGSYRAVGPSVSRSVAGRPYQDGNTSAVAGARVWVASRRRRWRRLRLPPGMLRRTGWDIRLCRGTAVLRRDPYRVNTVRRSEHGTPQTDDSSGRRARPTAPPAAERRGLGGAEPARDDHGD